VTDERGDDIKRTHGGNEELDSFLKLLTLPNL